MTDDLEIRELIAKMIAGSISPNDLESDLADYAWYAEEPTASFVATAMRLLAEHGHEAWSDEELREKMAALNQRYWFELAPRTITGSLGDLIEREIGTPAAGVGTQRVVAFV
jgi:hypothetical protein